MTQKELLYVEDAIGHEKNIISIMEEAMKQLEDTKLIDFLGKELKIHTNFKKKLMSMLEGKANE